MNTQTEQLSIWRTYRCVEVSRTTISAHRHHCLYDAIWHHNFTFINHGTCSRTGGEHISPVIISKFS